MVFWVLRFMGRCGYMGFWDGKRSVGFGALVDEGECVVIILCGVHRFKFIG